MVGDKNVKMTELLLRGLCILMKRSLDKFALSHHLHQPSTQGGALMFLQIRAQHTKLGAAGHMELSHRTPPHGRRQKHQNDESCYSESQRAMYVILH